MVGGHRAAGFGDHHRWRQSVLGAGFGQRLHQGVGELVQPVVDRAEPARTRALVVHAEAAAGVHVADAATHLRKLDEIAHGFAHAVGDVADVGDLRAHVEMQQLQGVEHSGLAQAADQVEHLPRQQAELGLVAAAVLPFAGTQRRQAHAHAEPGPHAEGPRLLEDDRQLGGFLDHQEGLQAELAADQRQADELAILVAVADHHAARPREPEHRHQLRLGARLQAEAFAALRGEFTGHVEVLVDLDRVDRGVAAGVIELRHGAAEGGLQLAQAVAEDVGEAQQQGQLQALARGLVEDLRQRERGTARAPRQRAHSAGRVHVEIAVRPVRDGIGVAGAVEGPGGHGRESGERGRLVYCLRPRRPGPAAGGVQRSNTGAPAACR